MWEREVIPPMNSQLRVLDNTDDRRELHGLLAKLPPRERVAFLERCCKNVPQGRGKLPVPAVWKMRATVEMAMRCDRADLALTNEIYCDLQSLFAEFGLDAVKTAVELERLVRKQR